MVYLQSMDSLFKSLEKYLYVPTCETVWILLSFYSAFSVINAKLIVDDGNNQEEKIRVKLSLAFITNWSIHCKGLINPGNEGND